MTACAENRPLAWRRPDGVWRSAGDVRLVKVDFGYEAGSPS